MSMFAKIMVVVNFILAVMFLAAAGTLLGAAEDYKARYDHATSDWKDEKAKLNEQVIAGDNKLKESAERFAQAQKELSGANASLRTLQDSAKAVEDANATLRASIEKMADSQKDLQGKNSGLNNDVQSLTGKLAESEADRKAANAKVQALSDENARVSQDKETAEKALAAAAAAAKTSADTIDSQATTLARYKQEFGQLKGAVVMTDVKGVVQACNNSLDISIISVGAKDGVKEGYEFTVYRGSEYVSTIVIDKVFPNYASGTTKPGTKKRDVMAGDEVATRL